MPEYGEDKIRVPLESILDRLSFSVAEQAIKVATLQASNSVLQDKVSQLTKQLDDAQIMVDSLLKKNMELTNSKVELVGKK